LDRFALRQFPSTKGGLADGSSSVIDADPIAFTHEINRIFEERRAGSHSSPLVDGYAPFCKHLFLPNFSDALCGYLSITAANEHLLRTEYQARTEKELPVLVRFFPRSSIAPVAARYLDIILYSREQIRKENAATGTECKDTEPWGIVSVKPQMENFETPMQPITMMRNALGVEEGGSGVKLDRAKYLEAVQFWRQNATLL